MYLSFDSQMCKKKLTRARESDGLWAESCFSCFKACISCLFSAEASFKASTCDCSSWSTVIMCLEYLSGKDQARMKHPNMYTGQHHGHTCVYNPCTHMHVHARNSWMASNWCFRHLCFLMHTLSKTCTPCMFFTPGLGVHGNNQASPRDSHVLA